MNCIIGLVWAFSMLQIGCATMWQEQSAKKGYNAIASSAAKLKAAQVTTARMLVVARWSNSNGATENL